MKTPRTRRTRVITAVLAALALGSSLGSTQAAVFKDAQWEALHEAGKFAELEQLAQARLMAKAMRSVGSLKDLWIRTLELEAAVRSSQPETARIIRVHIAGEAKKWVEMETELPALKPTKDAAMLEEVRDATMQLALVFLRDGKDLAKARSLYESLQRDQPSWAAGFYGAARVQAALGQADEAIRLFERARTLTGADDYPIDHRLGDTLLAKGDKAQAKAVYERFIANKRAKPANVEEVRKNLAKLG